MKLIRVYEKLLTVYPKSYRDEYTDEMSQTLTDMLADEQRAIRRTTIWLRAFAELPVRLFMANFHVLESAYGSNAPAYVMRNTKLSLALVTPFIALVIFNELRPNELPNSPRLVDALQFFTIGLPLIAFVLSMVTVLLWSYSRSKTGKMGITSNLTDIRHNWPLAVVGSFAIAIAIFMIGHDSMQCLGGNPIKEAQNFNATVRCISQD